jgi:hypothetical protein
MIVVSENKEWGYQGPVVVFPGGWEGSERLYNSPVLALLLEKYEAVLGGGGRVP